MRPLSCAASQPAARRSLALPLAGERPGSSMPNSSSNSSIVTAPDGSCRYSFIPRSPAIASRSSSNTFSMAYRTSSAMDTFFSKASVRRFSYRSESMLTSRRLAITDTSLLMFCTHDVMISHPHRQKVPQNGVAGRREDGLGMELHAFDGHRAMAHAHDDAGLAAGADLQHVRHAVWPNGQRVVARRM